MSPGDVEPADHGHRHRMVLLAALGALMLPLVAFASTRGDATPAPDFATEVAPVVRDTCAGCHRLGGIAPFAFRTARDLQSRAERVTAAVQTGLMPPWPPGALSPSYVGEEHRTLSQGERDTLLAWLKEGAQAPAASPVGRPRDATTRAAAGETVRAIAMPAPYTPTATEGGTDDYRCFLVDPRLKRGVFLTSARIEPGAATLVHHVILFRVPAAGAAAARKLDRASAGPGWTCFGGTGIPTNAQDAVRQLDNSPWVAAWAPGWGAGHLPAGIGVRLEAGTQIVMQVHYNLLNGRRPDRSRAVLTTVPGAARLTPVETTLLPAPVEVPCAKGESGPLCDRDAAIAEGVRKYGQAGLVPLGLLYLCGKDVQAPPAGTSTFCDRPVSSPTTIYGVAGHMHLLGVSIRVELNPDTPRSQVLLDIPRWDFHWQAVYRLGTPVRATPGDVLRVSCTFDPSRREGLTSPQARTPRYTVWGEGTTDEMCLGVLQVTRG